jgi:hypothetical protein
MFLQSDLLSISEIIAGAGMEITSGLRARVRKICQIAFHLAWRTARTLEKDLSADLPVSRTEEKS